MTPPVRTTRRLLAVNTVWTLLGLVVPAVIGLALTPAIVHGYGDERFGVLTLAWMIVGYFSLFDLGLGRAMTRRVSELLAAAVRAELHVVVWTGWLLMLLLGAVGGAVGVLAVPDIVQHAVEVSEPLRSETLRSFWLLALSVPIVVFTTGPRGVLEAAQRFGLVNAVRIPSGILTFVVPFVALRYTPELPAAIMGLIAVRLIGAVAYTVMAVRVMQGLSARPVFSGGAARDLLGFGAWMTVSNVISPMMVSFDRFAVSAFISVAAVTYYATPFEIASKVLFIPTAVATVLFPAFSGVQATDPGRIADMFRAATRAVFLLVYPAIFALICFAPEILDVWLGAPFPSRSSGVLRWMLFGILANSLGQLPFGLVQSLGRSDLTAKFHLAELVPYAVALVLLMRSYGIEGAAMAWVLRVVADTVVLTVCAARLAREPLSRMLPSLAVPLVLLALCIAAAAATGLAVRLGITALFIGTYAVAAWSWGGVGPIIRARVPMLMTANR